eukprot:1643103-Pleurochrysis_carterae.AAC.1
MHPGGACDVCRRMRCTQAPATCAGAGVKFGRCTQAGALRAASGASTNHYVLAHGKSAGRCSKVICVDGCRRACDARKYLVCAPARAKRTGAGDAHSACNARRRGRAAAVPLPSM